MTANQRVPWDSPTVRVVLLSTLLAPLGVPLVSPALPAVRDAFGLTDAQTSLLVSAYFVVGILTSPFIGALADRVGRRRVLVGSLLSFGVAGAATYFASTFEVVLVLRVMQGTAAAGLFITTVTLIGDVFDGVQRNAVLGVNVAFLSAGAALFPVVGGALVGVSWQTPFLLYAAALPVGLFAALTLPEPSRPAASRRGLAYVLGAVGALSWRDSTLVYGATFAAELILFGTILTTLPFVLTAEYGLAPVLVGVVIMAGELVAVGSSAANGRLSRFLSNRMLVALGFATLGAGLLVVWLAGSALLVTVGVGVVGGGIGLVLPSVDAALNRRIPSEFRGGAVSLRNSTTFLGRAVGPILFTGLAVTTGYTLLLGGAGVFALVLAGALFLVGGQTPPPVSTDDDVASLVDANR